MRVAVSFGLCEPAHLCKEVVFAEGRCAYLIADTVHGRQHSAAGTRAERADRWALRAHNRGVLKSSRCGIDPDNAKPGRAFPSAEKEKPVCAEQARSFHLESLLLEGYRPTFFVDREKAGAHTFVGAEGGS